MLAALRAPSIGGCVAAVFSGHAHQGGFAVDAFGVPHITFQSPLTHHSQGGAHALVEVSAGEHGGQVMRVSGSGAVPTRVLQLP